MKVAAVEKLVRLSAARAFAILLKEILPSWKRLSADEPDADDTSTSDSDAPRDTGGESSKDFGDSAAGDEDDGEDDEPEWTCEPGSGELDDEVAFTMLAGTHPESPKVDRANAQLMAELIEDVLGRRRARRRRGLERGTRLDVRSALAASVDRSRATRVWSRRSLPGPLDTAVSLLLDCSGSMAGDGKDVAAVAGAQVIARALSMLDVPFSVHGFQDTVFTLKAFDRPYDAGAESEIDDVVRFVRGEVHRGAAFNDDGPALNEVSQELEARKESCKILIVVSDGQPAGRHSDSSDLREVIARIRTQTSIALVGVGLGSGTSHVEDFYPEAIADVEPLHLPRLLADLLRRHLLAGTGRP
jgi:nitric oxide reductase activation protein